MEAHVFDAGHFSETHAAPAASMVDFGAGHADSMIAGTGIAR